MPLTYGYICTENETWCFEAKGSVGHQISFVLSKCRITIHCIGSKCSITIHCIGIHVPYDSVWAHSYSVKTFGYFQCDCHKVERLQLDYVTALRIRKNRIPFWGPYHPDGSAQTGR